MGLDKIKKSNRLLQSRRYTQENLDDNQEAFSKVLDLNASEIYINQNLIPFINLPFSGSTQSGSIFVSESKNIAKYYYRQPLTSAITGSGLPRDVWFFLDPTGSVPVSSQEIVSSQQVNFISPKYSSASLTLNETEATSPTLPGYNVVIYTGSSISQILNGNGHKVNGAYYQFDYKTGVLQFSSNPPSSTAFVTITAYQYLGDTLDQFIASGSGGGGTGTGFPFSGSAVITGSLLVSGSGITVTGSLNVTGSGITGSLFGTASWANNVLNAEFATTANSVEIIGTSDNFSRPILLTTEFYDNQNYSEGYFDQSAGTPSSSFTFNAKENRLNIGYISSSQPTGSIVLTGSMSVLSGSITLNSGSFIGTSSWALSASNALNAVSTSYATNAQNILPTQFPLPEWSNFTGSGIIVSSSTTGDVYNAIRIGNHEILDFLNSFTINVSGSNQPPTTISDFSIAKGTNYATGSIVNFSQNYFAFTERPAPTGQGYYNFRANSTDFVVYKSESLNSDATIAFDVSRVTGKLYASGGADLSGSTNIQNNLDVGGTLSAGASTLNSLTVTNLTTLNGNLVVNGTASFFGSASFVNVDNLLVEDKFILLNSGALGSPANEGGIVVQTTNTGVAAGTALFYEQTTNRWMVARSSSVNFDATSITVGATTDYVVTISASAGAPIGSPVNFGTGDNTYSVGQMYIQIDGDRDIYIYA